MSFPTFWDFVQRSSSNNNGVMTISKFDLLCDLVTQLFDLWPTKTTWFCAVVDYICGQSLVMISKKTATCIAENVTISFKHEYRRPTLTSRCDVISDVINIKNNIWGVILDALSISNVKWTYLKYFEIFKMAAILRSGRTFKLEVLPEVESYTKIDHAIPCILRFCWTF